MQKLLLFLILLFLVFQFRRYLFGGKASRENKAQPAPPKLSGENMRACAHCAVLVPESEGVSSGGDFFCSPEHARAGRKPPQ